MKKLFIICLFVALAMPFVGFSQNPLTKEEKVQAMYDLNKKVVQSQNFSFIATWVFSDDERSEVAENENLITIKGANFYGLLTNLDTDKPIMLKGGLENYTTNFNDEAHQIAISFKIGVYNAKIEVRPNGNAFLTLDTQNNETISYKGFVK
ncbi:DUF4251 domain-containing protein [Winogradskyella sp. HB-48]|uniref:DUF4251 domain-containing protein n=1 Tax=Winogradskyella sp. HB-48 TaxID=3416808 RepID=UPI003CF19D33